MLEPRKTIARYMRAALDLGVALERFGALILALALALTCIFASVASSAQAADAKPYVLAVSSARSFQTDLPALEFPGRDAQRFTEVMVATGQVPADHIVTLNDPSLAEVRAAFTAIQRRVSALPEPKPSKFMFYFSGHADTSGIHLRDGRLGKMELHELAGAVPVVTRVAFVDSCYSGALVAKGVKSGSAFQVPRAELDEPSGTVFLAAASGSEAAFEVDELNGSLFTHALVAGLYGQADADNDGLVTVDELYRFVFREVSLRTALLPTARAQTPEYRVDLRGHGALVLAFPKRATTPVRFAADLDGEITLAATQGPRLFRFRKDSGRVHELLVVPGRYELIVKQPGQSAHMVLDVKPDVPAAITLATLRFESAPDYTLAAKGFVEAPSYGVGFGLHTGYAPYAKPGPNLDVFLGTPAIHVRRLDLRAFAMTGFRTTAAKRDDVQWPSGEVSALAGFSAVAGTSLLPDAARLTALAAGGYGQLIGGDATIKGGTRRFDPGHAKIAAGGGVAWLRDSGYTLSLDIRREWSFFAEKGNDSEAALALATNIFALNLSL